tara:strand:- start:15973 stop:17766 length:1794 start_codon:yes stop_codon:yes gene_type:complete
MSDVTISYPNALNENDIITNQLSDATIALNKLSLKSNKLLGKGKILICTYARMNPPQRGHEKLIKIMNNSGLHYIKKGYDVDIIIFLYPKSNNISSIKHKQKRGVYIVDPTNPQLANPLTSNQREILLNVLLRDINNKNKIKDNKIGMGTRKIWIEKSSNTVQSAFKKTILSGEYDNILFFIGEDRKDAFGWEGRNKTFGPNNTPYLYNYVNNNIPGNLRYSLIPEQVSYDLDSKIQSKNKTAARKNASKKHVSQMPILQKNTIYNIIIPRTKKEQKDIKKMSQNKKLFDLYQDMIKNAKKNATSSPEFPSATMLRNLIITLDYQKYHSIIVPGMSNGWKSKKPNNAEWKQFQKIMITGLSDRELLNALANIKRGMGISLYHRYISTAPPIGSIASTVKSRKRTTKKKKGGRRKKRTRKKTKHRRKGGGTKRKSQGSNLKNRWIHLYFNLRQGMRMYNPGVQTLYVVNEDDRYLYLRYRNEENVFPLPKSVIRFGYVSIQIIRKKTKRGGGTQKKTTKAKIVQYGTIREELKKLNEGKKIVIDALQESISSGAMDMRHDWALINDLKAIDKEIEERKQALHELGNIMKMLENRKIGK